MTRYSHFLDLTGQSFGQLIVVKRANKPGEGPVEWVCKCSCGNDTLVISANLRNGTTKSCGCIRRKLSKEKFKTHGMTKTRTYRIWNSMKTRCLNKNATNYEWYGGIGVTICDRWMSFENFYEDMGEAPEKHSIDRIDVTKGYSPENCRWSTAKEQSLNKRKRRIFSEEALKKFLKTQDFLSKEQKENLIKNLFS